jgi:glutaredoxin
MTKISFDVAANLFKVLPILQWSKDDVSDYQSAMQLSQHPLSAKGFSTVGDAHSSRALRSGEANERSTRFNGKTQECGLHTQTVPLGDLVRMLEAITPLPNGYVLFTKPDCKYCKAAKSLLAEIGAVYLERDVTDSAVLAEMQQRLPSARTVPQIFLDNEHVGGFTDLHARLGFEADVDTYVKHAVRSQRASPRMSASCASCYRDVGASGPLGRLHCQAVCGIVA